MAERVKLTDHFYLDEFLVSSSADAAGIKNTPTPAHLNRLTTVTAPGMELIRVNLNRAIVITSAYRNDRVNRLVGGVPNSDHTNAYAVDSRAGGLSAYAYAKEIEKMMRPGGPLHGKIDQLILETSRSIVHVSFAPRLRGELLTQKRGPGTPFLQGIVV